MLTPPQTTQKSLKCMADSDYPIIWPAIEEEIAPFLKYCRGIVLNAGSGWRAVQLGQKHLSIDIVPDSCPNVIADLHGLPLRDDCVDTVVSIAVLEHTRFPWVVAQEFYRVLRPGGMGVIAVPFLQPQHSSPHDYVRFTESGLVELMRYAGFEVVETAHVHHFGQTIAWLLWEYLEANRPHGFLRPLWLRFIRALSQGKLLRGNSPNTHNTHYAVVVKPGGESTPQSCYRQAIESTEADWFYPLLACPRSHQPLLGDGQALVSADRQWLYPFQEGRPQVLHAEEAAPTICQERH